MKAKDKDVVSSTATEIVLRPTSENDPSMRLVMKGLGLASAALTIWFLFDGMAIFAPVTVVLAIASWHAFDRTTKIQFNQPMGYLTIEKSPWWSCFIPGGPYFVKRQEQVPLPREEALLERQSGTVTYPVRITPDTMEVRETSAEWFKVKLRLAGGKEFLVWSSRDWNSFVEVRNRVNRAIRENNYRGTN